MVGVSGLGNNVMAQLFSDFLTYGGSTIIAMFLLYIAARIVAHAYFEAKYHFIMRMRGQQYGQTDQA